MIVLDVGIFGVVVTNNTNEQLGFREHLITATKYPEDGMGLRREDMVVI